MKIKYLKEISAPSHLSGKVGDVRELESYLANTLIETGYVEEIKGAKKDVDERTNIKK